MCRLFLAGTCFLFCNAVCLLIVGALEFLTTELGERIYEYVWTLISKRNIFDIYIKCLIRKEDQRIFFGCSSPDTNNIRGRLCNCTMLRTYCRTYYIELFSMAYYRNKRLPL